MGDFTYKPIGDIQVGDTVVGWKRGLSARAVFYRGAGQRVFNTDTQVRTTVSAVHRFIDRTVTIRLASGQHLRCTKDHQWLCLRRHEYSYLRADQLRTTDRLARVDTTDPGDCPAHLRETAAWLAGFYDGEGHRRGVSQSSATLGGLLEKAQAAFHALGFETSRKVDKYRKEARKGVQEYIEWLGGRQAALRFARWVPSTRYRAKYADEMILGSRFRWLDTVVAVEENPMAEEVVCITTGTGNFIADGTCSHNCIAFYPQSTAAGVLKEAMLRLFDPESPSYIGDAYFGETPLRAPIHDSLLLEIPNAQWDRVCEHVFREMQRPILQQPLTGNLAQFGDYLSIGVAAKQGLDWADMRGVPVPGFTELGVGSEPIYEPMEADDQDDLNDFGREVA